jgi:uncharacterized protein YdhG (YjbR/CyaY superfamily)
MSSVKPHNVDDFIAGFPPETQKKLQLVRKTIRDVTPDAIECLSYGIPTYRLNNKNVIHFSAYATHIGIYPGAQAIIDFSERLKVYKTSKGAIQFPLDKPIPYDLIEKITRSRITAVK